MLSMVSDADTGLRIPSQSLGQIGSDESGEHFKPSSSHDPAQTSAVKVCLRTGAQRVTSESWVE